MYGLVELEKSGALVQEGQQRERRLVGHKPPNEPNKCYLYKKKKKKRQYIYKADGKNCKCASFSFLPTRTELCTSQLRFIYIKFMRYEIIQVTKYATQTGRQTDRQTGRLAYRQPGGHTHIHRERHTTNGLSARLSHSAIGFCARALCKHSTSKSHHGAN